MGFFTAKVYANAWLREISVRAVHSYCFCSKECHSFKSDHAEPLPSLAGMFLLVCFLPTVKFQTSLHSYWEAYPLIPKATTTMLGLGPAAFLPTNFPNSSTEYGLPIQADLKKKMQSICKLA